ncbi:peptidylprolyl isomerase [Belliella aquatica]
MNKIAAITLLCLMFNSFSYGQRSSPIGLIETNYGDIYIKLFEETPNHRESFIALAKSGYWDSLTFNRVIPNFVAQAGCPDTEEGFNDPEYLLEPEFVKGITHVYGAVGAGRDDNPGKLSARCQFYIVQNKNGLHRLDNDYTVFGQVISGMDIVDKIVLVKKDDSDEPLTAITMKVSIVQMTKREIEKLYDN